MAELRVSPLPTTSVPLAWLRARGGGRDAASEPSRRAKIKIQQGWRTSKGEGGGQRSTADAAKEAAEKRKTTLLADFS